MNPLSEQPASQRRRQLREARLYLVCDAVDDAFLDAALRGGVDVVQLRCKRAGDETILTAGARFARLCASHGALFIVNDRPDLAARLGADGVHVGQDDMAVGAAREVVGPDCLVGLSTHTPQQIDAAARFRPDYIGVGPVHATPTKPGRPPVGLELVRYAAARAPVPWFAIGGIDTGHVAAVREAGAERIAVVRALTESGDPEAAARRLRGALAGQGRMEQAGVGAQP
ncbi:MAG TPA: thiamine phosphate synthase [Solirubrobacteraceae bacterium]|nr:thiamine phosphate synthase [Solirubrobacteraceae bacterium]